jgi:hypothetical protein
LLEGQFSAAMGKEPLDANEWQTEGEKNLKWEAAENDKKRDQ